MRIARSRTRAVEGSFVHAWLLSLCIKTLIFPSERSRISKFSACGAVNIPLAALAGMPYLYKYFRFLLQKWPRKNLRPTRHENKTTSRCTRIKPPHARGARCRAPTPGALWRAAASVLLLRPEPRFDSSTVKFDSSRQFFDSSTVFRQRHRFDSFDSFRQRSTVPTVTPCNRTVEPVELSNSTVRQLRQFPNLGLGTSY